MPARLLPLVIVLLAGCGPTVTGSGTAATQDRPLPVVRGVRTGSHVANRHPGSVPLTVTWDDNLLDSVVTEVRDGLLEVTVKNGSYTTRTPLTVAVTLPALYSAKASGQSSIVAEVGSVPDFTAIASGQSKITLTGTAERQDHDASGQSRIDASGLDGKAAFVNVSGQSRVTLGVTDKVTGTASGQSVVEHAAAEQDLPVSGQATVRTR